MLLSREECMLHGLALEVVYGRLHAIEGVRMKEFG